MASLSTSSAHREAGYERNVFAGKSAQMTDVARFIKEKGFMPEAIVDPEVNWFYKYATLPSLAILMTDMESRGQSH